MFCYGFPFHSDCSVVNYTSRSCFSNCLHMPLLKNFSPHLLRAGWCRGIWKHSLCLLLPPVPCMQLQSDTMSCQHFGMIPQGQNRVKASFLKGMHTFPSQCCVTSPCQLWRKILQNGFQCDHHDIQIIVTNKSSQHSCSYSIVNCCCTACCRAPVVL